MIVWAEEYMTTVALEDGTISFNIWDSMGTDMITSISYSTDNGETWNTTDNVDNKSDFLVIDVPVNEGDKVLWKGIANQLGMTDAGSFFSSNCEFDAKGNVMSLLYGDDFKGKTTIEEIGAFSHLFHDISEEKTCSIVNAKDLSLPATTLATECYAAMFLNCTSLVTVPELPATTLANGCYSDIFNGCRSLVTVPQLPATTLVERCYGSMFQGCTSLTTAPQLPATTLTSDCYRNMFKGCTSLVTAPTLPATTLANRCYCSMFSGCTSLVTAPVLTATALADGCYYGMFSDCTSLVTAPALHATTLVQGCYSYMFQNCSQLNYIKAMFTTTPDNTYTYNWVSGVSSSGTFVKNSEATWNVTGYNGVPEGWTVQTASE